MGGRGGRISAKALVVRRDTPRLIQMIASELLRTGGSCSHDDVMYES